MSNYILHETIICDDRDPPWINKDIKQLILDKNHAYKFNIRNDKYFQFFNQFQFLQTKLSSLIEKSKNQYYARLSQNVLDPKTSQKSYWSILPLRITERFLAFYHCYTRTNSLLTSKKNPIFAIISLLNNVLLEEIKIL